MTQDKSLKGKAVDIKGKKYVLVADRILYFNETYPNGCIRTEQLASADRVEFKATVTPDIDKPERFFTGHSQAVWGDGYINKTSATENAETSAVGRALAMMGIGVIESIASADEMNKATYPPKTPVKDERTVKAGFCSICGTEGIVGRYGAYCPNRYDEAHKGKKATFSFPVHYTQSEQDFIESLPDEDNGVPIIK